MRKDGDGDKSDDENQYNKTLEFGEVQNKEVEFYRRGESEEFRESSVEDQVAYVERDIRVKRLNSRK